VLDEEPSEKTAGNIRGPMWFGVQPIADHAAGLRVTSEPIPRDLPPLVSSTG
jgi:hypothetical protein